MQTDLNGQRVFSSFLNFVSEPFLLKAAYAPPLSALPPKEELEEFISKYEQGVINPVSALHQFAQMHRVQLELKETSVAGKYYLNKVIFAYP